MALHWLGPWPLGHGHNQMELLSGARGATPPEKKCQPPYKNVQLIKRNANRKRQLVGFERKIHDGDNEQEEERK